MRIEKRIPTYKEMEINPHGFVARVQNGRLNHSSPKTNTQPSTNKHQAAVRGFPSPPDKTIPCNEKLYITWCILSPLRGINCRVLGTTIQALISQKNYPAVSSCERMSQVLPVPLSLK